VWREYGGEASLHFVPRPTWASTMCFSRLLILAPMKARSRHGRRAAGITGLAVLVLAVFLGSAGVAYAAAPFSGTPYDGPSVGGAYTVDLTPGCSDPNMGSYCTGDSGAYTAPTSLSIELDTHHRAGSSCLTKGYAFNPATIKPDGSFSTTAAFSTASPQLTFTVSGKFVSAGRVHGTVVGNHGCGTSSFTISIHPAPLISSAPCQLLTDVHAARTIAGGLAAENYTRQDSFSPQGGECSLLLGRSGAALQFIVGSTQAQLGSGRLAQDGEPYQHHQGVPGLGPGATLYVDYVYSKTIVKNGQVVPGKPTSAVLSFEVDFRRGGTWASISIPGYKGKCECFPASQFAAQKNHLLAVARAVRPLLH
jgi:hypothetical protein